VRSRKWVIGCARFWGWAGQVPQIQAALREQRERLGPPAARAKADHPRKIVSVVLVYVIDNAARMDYPRYRREGLSVTSTMVESLIKQFNQRVKGTEKFWLRGGAEAILQGCAAYLREDGRDEAFHTHRPRGQAVGQNRLRLIAGTVMHPFFERAVRAEGLVVHPPNLADQRPRGVCRFMASGVREGRARLGLRSVRRTRTPAAPTRQTPGPKSLPRSAVAQGRL